MFAFLLKINDEHTRSQAEEIYCLYSKDLLYIAENILKDPYKAEDVVQEAFIKLTEYINWDMDLKCNKTKGLIIIIVRSISINIYNERKNKPTVSIDEYEDSLEDMNSESPEPKVIRVYLKDRMAKQLDNIKKEYADILSLKYNYGYADTEIAHICDISEENVRARLTRAKQAMSRILGEDSDD
jgi:RNA polymerase sigma-70 factor, ECF subfamily